MNMKKHIIYTLAVLCMLPAGRLFAQSGADDSGNPEGIILNKTVSEQHPDESYTLTLDAFVTGTKVTKVVKTVTPCDIALVLDISSSMKNSAGSIKSYTELNRTSYSYNRYGDNNYYYKDGENYYLVQREILNAKHQYYLYFETGRTTYYLDESDISTTKPSGYNASNETIWTGRLYTKQKGGQRLNSASYSYDSYGTHQYYYSYNNNRYQVKRGDDVLSGNYALYYQTEDNGTKYYLTSSGVTTTAPTITDATATIWTGTLYRASSTTKTRLEALKEATVAFINEVAESAKGEDKVFGTEDDVAHQISILTFEGLGHVEMDLTQVTEESIADFIAAIEGLTLGNGTCSDLGLEKAKAQYDALSAERNAKSSKVVVMFTDGEPYAGSKRKDGITTTNGVINNAINISHTLKTTYEATVYTIGVFNTPLREGSTNANYMHYTSSEYPDAVDINTPGQKRTDGKIFYQYSDGSDLTAIFTSIAEETSTGKTSYDLDETNIVVVDVMSNLFMLPEGTDASKIKLYTAVCKGYDAEKDEYLFDTPQPAPGLSITIDGKEVDVTGFDFAENYVFAEKDDNDDIIGYGGKKLVIEIPIVVDPKNPGGANLITNNARLSGIYSGKDDGQGNIVKDEKIAGFPRPTVIKPNVIIQKKGLQHAGESATFLVERVNDINGTPYTGDQAFEPFSVSLTENNEYTDDEIIAAPAVESKVKLLDYGWYKVTETSWSSWYTPSAVDKGYFKIDLETKQESVDNTYTKTGTDAEGHPYVIRYVGKETEVKTGEGIMIEGEIFYSVGTPFMFHNTLLKSTERDPEKYSEANIVNKFPAKK